MNPILSASILSADFANLASEIHECEEAGVDWIHIDAMDGHFVPVLTMGPVIVQACRKTTSLPLDCHLITIHPERNPTIRKTLSLIRDSGCRPGIALNPETPLSVLEPLLALVDMVLIMTVNPGYSAQAFMPEMIAKLKAAASLIEATGREIRLEVDGGISPKTIGLVSEAGADTFVSASSIFKTEVGIKKAVVDLRMALK
jgi:ribulose-phosphate 3-epimerase